MVSTSTIYIVIVNYKNWEETVECIESVIQSSCRHFKIVVVDNNSGNRSLDSIRSHLQKAAIVGVTTNLLTEQEFLVTSVEHYPGVLLIQSSVNRGFAGGVN